MNLGVLEEATLLGAFWGGERKCFLLFFSILLISNIRKGPSLGLGLSFAKKVEARSLRPSKLGPKE